MGLSPRSEAMLSSMPKGIRKVSASQVSSMEGDLRMRMYTERSPVAKAAAGSPVAVGLSHPKGSSPFPLRHFLGERHVPFVKGVGVRASLRFCAG